jgi:hypothetical protein
LGVPVSVPQQGGNSGQQFVSYNGDTYLIQTGKVLKLVGWTGDAFSFNSSIAHFLDSTLISFNYYSPFYLRMVRTYFHSSISLLEWFVQDGEFSWFGLGLG